MNANDYQNLMNSVKQRQSQTQEQTQPDKEIDDPYAEAGQTLLAMTSGHLVEEGLQRRIETLVGKTKKGISKGVSEVVGQLRDAGNSLLSNATGDIKSTKAYKLATNKPNFDSKIVLNKDYDTIGKKVFAEQGRNLTNNSEETRALAKQAQDYFSAPDPEGDLLTSLSSKRGNVISTTSIYKQPENFMGEETPSGLSDPFSLPKNISTDIGRNRLPKMNVIGDIDSPKTNSSLLSSIKSKAQAIDDTAKSSIKKATGIGSDIEKGIAGEESAFLETGEEIDPIADAVEGIIGVGGALLSAFVPSHHTDVPPPPKYENYSVAVGS